MCLLNTIQKAWNWTGLNPAKVIIVNSFGNLIVQAEDGAFWKICPEELKCEKVADDSHVFAELWSNQNFQLDWKLERMVALAEKKLGRLEQDRCYCFKLTPVIGGAYDEANLAKISLRELIAFSGDLAEQVKDVPEGGQIEIKWIP